MAQAGERATQVRERFGSLGIETSTFPFRTSVVSTFHEEGGKLKLGVVAGGEKGRFRTLDELAKTVVSLVKGKHHVALVNTSVFIDAPVETHESRALELARSMGSIMPADGDGTQLTSVYYHGDPSDFTQGGLYSRSKRTVEGHTDNICQPSGIDALMLWSVRPAVEGGAAVLVSAKQVREILEVENPEAAALLADDEQWLFSTKGMGGDERVFTSPILSTNGEARYKRDYVERASEMFGGKSLTQEQINALDALDHVLAREELWQVIELKAGDALITQDNAYFHFRLPWTDPENIKPGEGRRMSRVWISFDEENKIDSP